MRCDVDLATADVVRDRCLAALTNDHVGLIIDLSRSEFLDSAGIRALYTIVERLAPHRQQLVVVVPANSHMRKVLALVAFERSSSIQETIDAAFGWLRASGREMRRG